MRPTGTRSSIGTGLWLLLILSLLVLRLPAMAEPAGNDQSLYMYAADRVRAGGVPYVDAWDQKPPAVIFVYAALRSVWPDESVVAVADLLAATLVAGLLVGLGRRTIGTTGGLLAATAFLLFSHPSIARLSGAYVRGQCEVFIGAAVVAALWLVWRERRHRAHDLLAGVWLGIAFWLKYNAIAYAAPVALAAIVARGDRDADRRRSHLEGLAWMAGGFLLVAIVVLAYFAAHGALDALRLATLDYNLRYSGETYRTGLVGGLAYIARLPWDHARAEMLWFLGGVGAILLVITVGHGQRTRAVELVAFTWLAAALASIAINGARDLPQYFIQAGPALAFCFAAGATRAWHRGLALRTLVLVLVALGLWKVGTDDRVVLGLKWGGVPQLVDNVVFDIRALRGQIDRQAYLARFRGGQKYDASAVADLARYVARTTTPADRILVFGFAPAVYLESGRVAASRFFWSRPVILEFAADRPGYGSRGLLADLERTRPLVIALQKVDWAPDVPNSREFFLATPALRNWLAAGYVLDHETPVFSVWRRIS